MDTTQVAARKDVLDMLIDEAARLTVYAAQPHADGEMKRRAREADVAVATLWRDMLGESLPPGYVMQLMDARTQHYRDEVNSVRAKVVKTGLLTDAMQLLDDAARDVEQAVGGTFAAYIRDEINQLRREIMIERENHDGE